jgi:hypothetical protein
MDQLRRSRNHPRQINNILRRTPPLLRRLRDFRLRIESSREIFVCRNVASGKFLVYDQILMFG